MPPTRETDLNGSTTDVLIKVMDELADKEGRGILVIWTNEEDELCWAGNTRKPAAVGFCDITKDFLKGAFRR